ncbi:F-box protein SKIP23-like [Vicia villosa]|uniref:F-box protein SKIP23-like n=1 Tax=Vicia villosa TaxID=3911 RepID=UPI00273AE0F5|nr:F-box protein SKIP23-like [Vicia villosa]
MADSAWADLPKEILNLISKQIENELDLVHFRSVCSSWRSSSIPIPPNILFKFPLISYSDRPELLSDIINGENNTPFCYLSQCCFLLIKPPQQQRTMQAMQRPWLIQITKNTRGKIKLFPPFITYHSSSPFLCDLRVLDFNKFPVVQLGSDFVINNQRSHFIAPEKVVAVMRHGEKPAVLGIVRNAFFRKVIFRYHNEQWKVIENIAKHGDICVFKGKFYAVDGSGRTVTVEHDDDGSGVELVDSPLIVGDRKLLVESDGELLLVNIYDYLWFSVAVFRLDEKGKKWVKLKSIGDRVLFLGNEYLFCASASDLRVGKGNCVVFMDDRFLSFQNRQHGKCVYHLDRYEFLADYEEYFNLFSPPEWIVKS